MRYSVRPMRMEDVPQVAEIDREAFSTQWPSSSYIRELHNRVAYYFVVGGGNGEENEEQKGIEATERDSGLASRVKGLFNKERFSGEQAHPTGGQYILGFTGFWMIHYEAHLSTIAVRESYLRRGIGELLLISVTDKALELKARVITLEVRPSNRTARSLYEKYGFTEAGIRRGYYTDDGEDALLMTTEPVTSPSFQSQFQQLKETHAQRWGIATTFSSNS